MKKIFFTGLVILLPLALTYWIVMFLVDLLTHPFSGWVMLLFKTESTVHLPQTLVLTISRVSILILLFLVTVGIGIVARRFFFKQLLHFGDRIVQKIPLINKVYKTSKELVVSLFSSTKQSFQKVVIFPFPRKNSYCLGLVVSEVPDSCKEALNHQFLSVFVPTTPNPTSGYLILVKKEELIYLSMKPEDAIKYVMSCGVIQPEYPQKQEDTL